jgi:hypothetical protein
MFPVECHEAGINQVFMDLLNNAIVMQLDEIGCENIKPQC